ncbi:aminomethyl-transferring glycine dehydrogenase subunit GcvPA [Promethearchaeum syntrophicum]|uniref:Aminomethyl-transferring glycine dehydrogenase subunit GcvPA n=1 Tax=Promethearchaeum syntrophicum TaxID=2594042 RepID=A0A5B9D6R7_9ARCH|nr:aminomethyl-transferring glycine dehydrogenase subunit GcvPA [Candidatus Prometheoarchaeum syntrophicum]QEE14663.1 glycine dehydrogenase subunit 1 [Candidatus Prometheoarchaeum syntrophicum]
MDYVPHDEETIQTMLKNIGVEKLDDLYSDIPNNLKIKNLNLPEGLPESDLLKNLTNLSKKNHIYQTSFLGAGSYYHYIPSLVDFVISQSQFFTSYTPYQAEISQGMLQSIYEYQSAISRITEMDVTNASMYDCASALAEAATMAFFITKKRKILLIEGIHPEYIETVKTYCWGRSIETEIIPLNELNNKLTDEIAGVLIQSPNFFGEIEDISQIAEIIRSKSKKCLLIQAMSDPTCLGYLNPPGKTEVDIFVSEGVGMHPSFGGPNLGILSVKNKYMRKMPGRLVGLTKELQGEKEGYVLTIQAREQHIRREKALSNICSNQGLAMVASLVYLVSLGKTGLKEVAMQNFQKANHLKQALSQISGYEILNTKPTYNEFVVKCPNINKLIKSCKEENILPPLRLSHYFPDREDEILICVTELNSKEDIIKFVHIAQEAK